MLKLPAVVIDLHHLLNTLQAQDIVIRKPSCGQHFIGRGTFIYQMVILLLLLHFIYVFPLEARYQNGLLAGLANARGIFIVHLKRSLALTGILLAEFLLVTQFNTPLRTFSILVLAIPMIYTISKAVMPVFRKLEDKDGKK